MQDRGEIVRPFASATTIDSDAVRELRLHAENVLFLLSQAWPRQRTELLNKLLISMQTCSRRLQDLSQKSSEGFDSIHIELTWFRDFNFLRVDRIQWFIVECIDLFCSIGSTSSLHLPQTQMEILPQTKTQFLHLFP